METTAAALLPRKKQDSLAAWFALYMGTQVGDSESNTFKAKKRDLEKFLGYLYEAVNTDHPDQWTKSITESFLSNLYKKQDLAASTVNRVLATIKHCAKWIHTQRPFLVGNPCDAVKSIDQDDPDWHGLEAITVNRLKSAAEQLIAIQKRANQLPWRNQAILLLLLRTGIRSSELLGLKYPNQYKDGYLHNVKRKGKKVTKKIKVPAAARKAIEDYIEYERGTKPGPLFLTKNGQKLARQNLDDLLKAIAAHANSTLPLDQRIHLSAHMFRHTSLRKAAEKDIRYAMKLSGHTSSKYIWQYTEPGQVEFDEALEDMFD